MLRLRAGESCLASASSSPAYMIQLAKPDESGGLEHDPQQLRPVVEEPRCTHFRRRSIRLEAVGEARPDLSGWRVEASGDPHDGLGRRSRRDEGAGVDGEKAGV